MKFTPEFLSSVGGILLSLAVAYIPGFNAWFAKLDGVKKRLLMVGGLGLVTLAAFGLSCVGWFDPLTTCDQAGIENLLASLFLAAVANQTAYGLTTASSKKRQDKLRGL